MSKYHNQADQRAKWIWSMYEQNGHVSTLEIKQQFGRAGRELEKELLNRGVDLPPLITENEAAARRQSELLIEAAGDQPMTMKQIAKVLQVKTPSKVSATLKKLRKYDLPVPKVKKTRQARADTCDVELPPNMREQVSTRYPSYLQYISCRPIEMEDGKKKIAYLLW